MGHGRRVESEHSPALAADASSEGEVGEQHDQEQKDEARDTHEPTPRDRARSPRLHPCYGGDGGHENRKAEPNDPLHARIMAQPPTVAISEPNVLRFVA